MTPEEQGLLDRYELDRYEEEWASDTEFQNQEELNSRLISDPDRWARAATLLRPRSRFGFILGVSRQDLNRAVARLEKPAQLPPGSRALKRFADIVFAVVILLAFSPVLLVIAVAIRVGTGGGPALVQQIRIGQDGKTFRMLLFATRYRRVPGHDLSHFDTPVSRLARFLERHSINEIPQLINVLGGTMSVVGPRPGFVNELDPVSIRPGITGLWVVQGIQSRRADRTARYVESWSLGRDVVILWRTVFAVTKPDPIQ